MLQNPIVKFRQISFISEKPGFFPEKSKTLTSPATIELKNFCWNFAHVSVLPMSTKRCSGLFLFCLDPQLLINLVSVSIQKPGLLLFWQITQVLNKIKKILNTLLNLYKISTKNIKVFGSWSTSKFSIFGQNTWFLENNNKALFKFLYGILYYLISINKL